MVDLFFYNYLDKDAICASRTAILERASDCFLRSTLTTASGALETNRSLLSFFSTDARNPMV